MKRFLCCLALSACIAGVQAGAQKEEDLSDAVRGALHAAVVNDLTPHPPFKDSEQYARYLRWMTTMQARLGSRTPMQLEVRTEFLKTVWYESTRAGLEPSLVLGLIQVESNFRKFAISSMGARGFMQVMPFWTRQIGDGEPSRLFHMQTNLRFGCVILRHYLEREKGNLFMALGRYNGSRGQSPYPNAVLAAQKAWME